MPSKKSIRHKAGVVLYRRNDKNEIEILLISARKYPGSWVFPVGSVKKGETLQEAAARECLEETGYRVEVGSQVGVIETGENGSTRRFTFFLAKAFDEVELYETDRQQKWVPLPGLGGQVAPIFAPVAKAVIEAGLL